MTDSVQRQNNLAQTSMPTSPQGNGTQPFETQANSTIDSNIASATNTTVGADCATCPKNFIIILGGPGIYNSKDVNHDRYWKNYYRTMLDALKKNPPDKDEVLHVIVPSEVYTKRYNDDKGRQNEENGPWQPKLQRWFGIGDNYDTMMENEIKYRSKTHIQSEVGFITFEIEKYKVSYKRIYNKAEIINYINSLRDNSITRLWFIGHAVQGQLWLSLRHSGATAIAPVDDLIVNNDDLKLVKKEKIYNKSDKLSQFIGCHTAGEADLSEANKRGGESSAETWNKHTGLKSRGFSVTINFINYEKLMDKNPPHQVEIFE